MDEQLQQQEEEEATTNGAAVCSGDGREPPHRTQEEEEETLLDKRKATTWRKSPAFVSSSQLLELLKAGAYEGPDTAKEEAEAGVVPPAPAPAAVGQALETEDGTKAVEAGSSPCKAPEAAAAADTDPFDAPLCAGEGEDPFLPEADPVLGVDGDEGEDDQDIFLSQTEEEAMREAALEAAAIREVFGAPDLRSLFAAVSAPSGTVEAEDEEAAASATEHHQPDGVALAKKRKRCDDEDLKDEDKLVDDEGRTSEPAANEKRKKLEAGTTADLGAKAEEQEQEESA